MDGWDKYRALHGADRDLRRARAAASSTGAEASLSALSCLIGGWLPRWLRHSWGDRSLTGYKGRRVGSGPEGGDRGRVADELVHGANAPVLQREQQDLHVVERALVRASAADAGEHRHVSGSVGHEDLGHGAQC